MDTLPRDWRDLPESMRLLVHGQQEPQEDVDYDAASILRQGRMLPKRDTNVLLKKASAPPPAPAAQASSVIESLRELWALRYLDRDYI